MKDIYAKYQDKNLFEKPNKTDAEKVLMDLSSQEDADKIVEKFRSRPVYLKEVAIKLAKEVLKTEDNTQNDIYA